MGFWGRLFGKSKEANEPEEKPLEAKNDLVVEADNATEESFDETISNVNSESLALAADENQGPESPPDNEARPEEVSEEPKKDYEIESASSQDEEVLEGADSSRTTPNKMKMPIPNQGSHEPQGTPEGPEKKSSGNSEEQDSGDDDPELESNEHFEDLSILDGHELPELVVPTWQDELSFVERRYEPCDLSEHIVKVSRRRLEARRIDYELAKSRKNAYERHAERATRRFKDKLDEDAILKKSLDDVYQWRSFQAKSVAWKLAERINEELLKAKQAELEATAFVEENNTFTNPEAVGTYRHFARRVFLIPLVTLYIGSVVGLTYFKFDWILKFLPFFNLGIKSTLIMIAGVSSGFFLKNLWRYSKSVSLTQKKLVNFNDRYQDQYNKIRHAVKEHTRLAQQQPGVEPRLRVLAKAYRVQLQSDVSIKAHATTFFDPASLPACVTLARAVDNDEMKMAKLKRQALRVLMRPGWRTNGLDQIASIHADSKMLDSNAISLRSLDTDSVVSATNAQIVLLEAFSNTGIHERISKSRLVKAIQDLHKEVLAKWESEDRPEVVSLREEGFNKLSFRSSWLQDEDVNENWIEFLTEILSEETAPFSTFNIHDKRSQLNNELSISSVAVVPHYFKIERAKLKVEPSKVEELTPLDVVVRVDVSPWAEPSAFSVFAEGLDDGVNDSAQVRPDEITGGETSA